MIKFEKIKAGDVLFDVHSYRMGNTTIRSMGCWEVKVVEVYPDKRSALVSWNGNTPEVWHEYRLARLRAKEPEFEKTWFGAQRIKRRAAR